MGVTKMVGLINTFLAQSCMSVRKSGHEMVNTTIDIFSSARNKDQKLVGRFFKNWIFYRLLHCCPIENVWEIWPIKTDFGQPNAEIGRKMTSDQLLFLTLI